MKNFLQWVGLLPTDRDKELIKLVKNSYKSLRVVGRGIVIIDPSEVYNSKEFQQAPGSSRKIVR